MVLPKNMFRNNLFIQFIPKHTSVVANVEMVPQHVARNAIRETFLVNFQRPKIWGKLMDGTSLWDKDLWISADQYVHTLPETN